MNGLQPIVCFVLDGAGDHLNVSLSSDGAQIGSGVFHGSIFGTVGANSRVTVVG